MNRQPLSSFHWLQLAVIILCAIQSQGLYIAWMSAPFEYKGWIAFLFWSLPIPFYWIFKQNIPLERNRSAIMLGIALIASIMGTLSNFNTFHYVSLAVALASLIPFWWPMIAWILLSIVWMPGFGWLISQYMSHYEMVARIVIAFLAAAGTILFIHKKELSL